jgi:hypothetical protein
MTTEQRLAGQRSQTRSFVYLAWPALVVWGLTLVFVACPEGHSYVHVFVRLGVVLAVGAFCLIALGYTVAAAMANAPTKIRLLACAANLSVVVLLFLDTPSFRSLVAFGSENIARARCRDYYDCAETWGRIKKKLPDSLEEMEAPLREGEAKFIYVEDDPWGNPYVLKREGNKLHVHSWGPDGKEGTQDDIVYPEDK